MEEENVRVSRVKGEFGEFTGEVQKIFVDSSVAVIDRLRELVNGSFDELKGVIDDSAGAVSGAADRTAEYVRRNPWKAAAAFMIASVVIGILSDGKKGSGYGRI